jgi:hypothetical protein
MCSECSIAEKGRGAQRPPRMARRGASRRQARGLSCGVLAACWAVAGGQGQSQLSCTTRLIPGAAPTAGEIIDTNDGGGPDCFVLQATAGVTYDIVVALGTLSDSCLQLVRPSACLRIPFPGLSSSLPVPRVHSMTAPNSSRRMMTRTAPRTPAQCRTRAVMPSSRQDLRLSGRHLRQPRTRSSSTATGIAATRGRIRSAWLSWMDRHRRPPRRRCSLHQHHRLWTVLAAGLRVPRRASPRRPTRRSAIAAGSKRGLQLATAPRARIRPALPASRCVKP